MTTMYRGFALKLSPAVADTVIAALNAGDDATVARAVLDWSEGSQAGFNDGTGVGAWWSPNMSDGIMYGAGGNLYTDRDTGGWGFEPHVRSQRLGVVLEGTPSGRGENVTYFPGLNINVTAVNLYHREGDPWTGGAWKRIPCTITVRAHTAATKVRCARGFPCTMSPSGDEPGAKELYEHLRDGSATAAEILRCASQHVKRRVGDNWGLSSDDSHWGDWAEQGAMDYAYADDSTKVRGFTDPDEGYWAGEISVVLVGHTEATYVDVDWDASLPRGSKIELDEIRYDAGWGWVTLPAYGISALATVGQLREQARWFDEDEGRP